MFKLIKRTICLSVIAVIVFFVIALRSGGEKFRWLGEKTGGVIKETSDKLGQKADEIKGTMDETVRSFEKITGRYKEESQRKSTDTSKENERKPETGGTEEGGNKTAGKSQHQLWDSILEKIRALTKG